MKTRRDSLILVTGLLVMVGLFVFFYWLPHNRHVARMQGDIAQRRGQIDLERNKLAQLAGLHADLAALNGSSREMSQRIPAAVNVREFHATVHDLSEKHRVTLSSDTPLIPMELVGFQQQPVSLTLTGRFHGVVQLLHELETMTPLIEVTDLDLKPTAKPGEPSETLEVKLDVKLFARPAHSPAPSEDSD